MVVYRELCQKMLELDQNIREVFIVNSEARLVAFSGAEDAIEINELRLAELMDDLLFMVGCRRHCEDMFGTLQYLHIRHQNSDTLVLPFEMDKLLCICLRTHKYNETQLLQKLQNISRYLLLQSIYL